MPKNDKPSKAVVLDRMRYVKDTIPSTFALIAIVLDVLYFVLIYKINKDYFYNYKIGVSVVINLFFMLFAFLCSEEVKNYHGKYGYLMIGLGVVQIIRIFIFPVQASAATTLVGDEVAVMSSAEFVRCCIYLCLSALFMIVGGIISIRNSKTLETYLSSLENE